MKRYTPEQIEMLTNHDGLLCKPPFRNEAEECQYYSRYATLRLWRYLVDTDWRRMAKIVDKMRVPRKTMRIAKFLLLRKRRK